MKAIFKIFINKLYGKFNGKLFAYASIPGSWVALFYVLMKKKKNQIILLPTNAIGDTLYAMSFLDSLESYANQNHMHLFVYASDRYKTILDTYPILNKNVVFIKHLGFKHLLLLTLTAASAPKSVVVAAKKRIYSLNPPSYGDYIPEDIKGVRNLLSYIMDVPTEPISYHSQPTVKIVSIDDFDRKKDRICIVNPYSQSMAFSESLFEKICMELKNKNFIVYTNIVGNQKEIKGTFPLRCNIEELYTIACKIPLVVSIRSGILDYLIPSNVNMYVVYETWKGAFNAVDPLNIAKHCSLKEWQPKGLVQEVYMEKESDESKILYELDEYLNKLNLDV